MLLYLSGPKKRPQRFLYVCGIYVFITFATLGPCLVPRTHGWSKGSTFYLRLLKRHRRYSSVFLTFFFITFADPRSLRFIYVCGYVLFTFAGHVFSTFAPRPRPETANVKKTLGTFSGPTKLTTQLLSNKAQVRMMRHIPNLPAPLTQRAIHNTRCM